MKYALPIRRFCAPVFAAVLVLMLTGGLRLRRCHLRACSRTLLARFGRALVRDRRLFRSRVVTLAEGLTYPYGLAFSARRHDASDRTGRPAALRSATVCWSRSRSPAFLRFITSPDVAG